MPASTYNSLSQIMGNTKSRVLRRLEAINGVLTVVVVAFILALGVYAVDLFMSLYNPQVQERKVSTFLSTGRADVFDPAEIRRTVISGSMDGTSGRGGRDTKKPLWMLMETSRTSVDFTKPVVLDIRSIAASSFNFWLIPADRSVSPLDMSGLTESVDGGLYVHVPAQDSAYDIVGSVTTGFLFKPKVLAWENASAELLTRRFSKTGVAVWSIFLGLAAFSLCVAAVNRSFMFVIFSAWLLASIRIAGFNNGWDFNWLGVNQWEGFALVVLRMSIAAYAFLTCVLFAALFDRSQTGATVHCAINVAAFVFACFIAMGSLIPMDIYMTAFRICASIALLVIAAGVVNVLRRGKSMIAWLYTGSYSLMITGMLIEILFQTNVVPALGDTGINSTGGALASAIVMSVALAAQIQEERVARQKARTGELNALREFERIYTRTPIGLFSIHEDGSLLNANSTFRDMFALDASRDSSANLIRLWSDGLAPICRDFAPTEQVRSVEFWLSADESSAERWYSVDLALASEGFDGSISDITGRKSAEAKLEYLARHDATTGALNVGGFEAIVDEFLRLEKPAVLGHAALDRFEFLHKIHGRQLAEKLLTQIIGLLRADLPDAVVGRDGDKIYLLLEGDDVNEVRSVLNACFVKLKKSGLTIGSVEIMPDLHAGLCVLDGDRSAADAILRANLAHDVAQGVAKDPVVVAEFNESAIIRELDSTRLAGGLESYIKAGRFFLVAQPIIDIQQRDNKPSFEFLLRMRGDAGEVISPWQFVPVAEKLGVMSMLDRFVLAESFRLIQSGELDLHQIGHLSVNLSGSSLNDLEFLNDIYDLITTTNVDLEHFCFEITESVALNSFARTKEFLAALKELGARTAIDDFGAGHSSIHYLTELAPDYLKLDGSLITKVLSHPVHGSFVRKMVEIADEVGVQCVGEFVETKELEAALVAMGVRYGQGYLYAAPMPVAEMKTFCADWMTRHCLEKLSTGSTQSF